MTLELAGDPVPNIRFNAAKTLAVIGQVLLAAGQAGEVEGRIRPKLEALLSDADEDVVYYARQALDEGLNDSGGS